MSRVGIRTELRVDSTKNWLGDGEMVTFGGGGWAQVVQEAVGSLAAEIRPAGKRLIVLIVEVIVCFLFEGRGGRLFAGELPTATHSCRIPTKTTMAAVQSKPPETVDCLVLAGYFCWKTPLERCPKIFAILMVKARNTFISSMITVAYTIEPESHSLRPLLVIPTTV